MKKTVWTCIPLAALCLLPALGVVSVAREAAAEGAVGPESPIQGIVGIVMPPERVLVLQGPKGSWTVRYTASTTFVSKATGATILPSKVKPGSAATAYVSKVAGGLVASKVLLP